jgi:hypothetical protein
LGLLILGGINTYRKLEDFRTDLSEVLESTQDEVRMKFERDFEAGTANEMARERFFIAMA